jgi:hypothetical protein
MAPSWGNPITPQGVVPTGVVNAGDGWPVSDPGVGSALVVVVEPVWRCGGAGVVVVGDGVDPFAAHGLVEALDFSVGARGVRPDADVADPAVRQEAVK